MPSVEELPAPQVAYLTMGAESRALEFKSSYSWDSPQHQLRLIRTLMAMSNNRDGGAVVIGVTENEDGTYTPTGVEDDDFTTFDPDIVADRTSKFSDAPLNLTTIKGGWGGMLFVVFEVGAADRAPTICKSADGGQKILQNGQVYVRPLGKPETRAVTTHQEMRDLIDQAVDREIERFRSLGLISFAEATEGTEQADFEGFDKEIAELL